MKKQGKNSQLQIRNSTAEFLTFAYQSQGNGVEVRVQDGTIWLSQKNMGLLFDTSADNIGLHLKNIYAEGELDEISTAGDFSAVQREGSREVCRTVKHYNLDAIIAVGYRVNSKRATAFRQWATAVLRDFTLRGYIIDRKRMENGAFLGDDYFERLLEEIREIRL
ncbi:MAG: virulence RhuM family protein, partial [Bacteroidales bacterium]|nr:virulence RhuM family protein [Bacteroidales bacterium]